MVVTMKDIARLAGCSSATVSKVLNGADQHISQATRERILKIVEDSGYVRNSIARGLKKKNTNIIAFVLPDIANPFFPEIVKGIEDESRRFGFALIVCNTDNNTTMERNAFKFLSSKMVDGIIFTHSIQSSDLEDILTTHVPIVIVDRLFKNETKGLGQVYIDTREAFIEGTTKLLEKGCRNLVFISGGVLHENDRYQGFCTALTKAGLDSCKEMTYMGQYDVETGYVGIENLLRLYPDIDGVICGNDLIAIGAMKALQNRGLRIPQDVKIIGFDDIYLSQYMLPALSTIHQPAYEIGVHAARMLIHNILHGEALKQEKLEYQLIMRDSV